MTFGIACRAIERMRAGAGSNGSDQFGTGAFRGSPKS
jgi:hypothetical protein